MRLGGQVELPKGVPFGEWLQEGKHPFILLRVQYGRAGGGGMLGGMSILHHLLHHHCEGTYSPFLVHPLLLKNAPQIVMERYEGTHDYMKEHI